MRRKQKVNSSIVSRLVIFRGSQEQDIETMQATGRLGPVSGTVRIIRERSQRGIRGHQCVSAMTTYTCPGASHST